MEGHKQGVSVEVDANGEVDMWEEGDPLMLHLSLDFKLLSSQAMHIALRPESAWAMLNVVSMWMDGPWGNM
jgi:hypothetical protein